MFFDSDLDSIKDRIFAAYATLVGCYADLYTGREIRRTLPVGTLADTDADTDADARTIMQVGDGVGIDVSDLVEALYNPADWYMAQIGHPDAYARR